MSFPSMPLMGPQMLQMAPDGTFLNPGAMPGYATHMGMPYAVFPGGMQMNPMQVRAPPHLLKNKQGIGVFCMSPGSIAVCICSGMHMSMYAAFCALQSAV